MEALMSFLQKSLQKVLLKIKQCACPHNVNEVINTSYQPHVMMDDRYVHVIYTKKCEKCGKTMNTQGIEPKQNMKNNV